MPTSDNHSHGALPEHHHPQYLDELPAAKESIEAKRVTLESLEEFCDRSERLSEVSARLTTMKAMFALVEATEDGVTTGFQTPVSQ